jgi:hypothetical protein
MGVEYRFSGENLSSPVSSSTNNGALKHGLFKSGASLLLLRFDFFFVRWRLPSCFSCRIETDIFQMFILYIRWKPDVSSIVLVLQTGLKSPSVLFQW